MHGSGTHGSDLEVREAIVAEHDQLEGLLQQLEAASHPRQVPLELQGLEALLLRHFAREEAAEGLYDVLRTRAPRHRDKVETLRGEHRALLAELSRLVRRSAAQTGQETLLEEVGRLCRQLRRHEEQESFLMIDALSRRG